MKLPLRYRRYNDWVRIFHQSEEVVLLLEHKGQVRVPPTKKIEHLGMKVELLGEIGMYLRGSGVTIDVQHSLVYRARLSQRKPF